MRRSTGFLLFIFRPVGFLFLIFAVVVCSACARTSDQGRPPTTGGSEPPKNPTDSPADARRAEAWVQDQIKVAMGRHGNWVGDEWRSVYWSTTTDEKGNTVEVERSVVVKGIKFKPSREVERLLDLDDPDAIRKYGYLQISELTPADKLNGAVWRAQTFLSADGHRYGDVNENPKGRWSDEAGPLSLLRGVYADRNKDGSVGWSLPGRLGPDNPTGLSYLYYNQGDFFDSVLQYFYSPSTTAEQRRAIRAMRGVLRQDETANAELGGRTKQPKEIAEAYVPRMEKIDLSQCPADFRTAYQEHIKAWRTADLAAITSTHERVIRIARGYGAGTIFTNLDIRYGLGADVGGKE